MIRRVIIVLLSVLSPGFLALGGPARGQTFQAGGGTYHVVTPPGWDGTSRLPMLLFLHGWQGSGADIAVDPAVSGPAARVGFLLVAPDGAGRSWGHVGSPARTPGRDDRAFLRTVVADAQRRFPVDPANIVAGGFSQGGSMVWDLACYDAPLFHAFLPISGGFWAPMAPSCTSGPVNLRHVHGLADTTVPMTGRSLFPGYRQEDIRIGFTRWIAADSCTATHRQLSDGLDCEIWPCRGGHELELCTHAGDHEMQPAWLEAGLRWARALPR